MDEETTRMSRYPVAADQGMATKVENPEADYFEKLGGRSFSGSKITADHDEPPNPKLPYSAPDWKTASISPTCEYMPLKHVFCGQPTRICYPAMGAGWMALCAEHGAKHLPHAFDINDLIQTGETFQGVVSADVPTCVCPCGNTLTEDEIISGYMDISTGKQICEGCWDAGQIES